MRIILLIALLIAQGALADIYKTHDKNGNVVYTDSPKSHDAEKVQLKEINTTPSITPDANATPPQRRNNIDSTQYEIRIISPKSDVTIPPGQRDLAIAVQVNPELGNEHLLVYFMDGELLEESQMNNIVVKDAPRGSHTLVVEAINSNGQSLGISAPTIVNIIRPTVQKAAPIKPKAK